MMCMCYDLKDPLRWTGFFYLHHYYFINNAHLLEYRSMKSSSCLTLYMIFYEI